MIVEPGQLVHILASVAMIGALLLAAPQAALTIEWALSRWRTRR